MTTDPPSIRLRVLAVMSADPETARAIANRAGVSYLQAVFALQWLVRAEYVAREGRKSAARWRSFTPAEAADAARRRARAAAWALDDPPAPEGGGARGGTGPASHTYPPSEKTDMEKTTPPTQKKGLP